MDDIATEHTEQQDETIHIADAVARDPIAYRRAKADAAAAGKALVIDPPVAPSISRGSDVVMIPKNASVTLYRALRADAVKRGVPWAIKEDE